VHIVLTLRHIPHFHHGLAAVNMETLGSGLPYCAAYRYLDLGLAPTVLESHRIHDKSAMTSETLP
jgi:hypothetical protein